MESDGGDAAGPDEDWAEAVAPLFDGVGHPTRIAILAAVRDDRPMSAVAEDRGVSRNTVQDHLNKLIETDLVYRPQDSAKHYALTPFGRFFARFLDEHGDVLHTAIQQVDTAETEAKAEFEDVPLDETTQEKAVTNRTWELVSTEIQEMLESELSSVERNDSKTEE